MGALLIGSVLAVAGLAYVLWPVIRGEGGSAAASPASDAPPESSAIEALREIEFDQETGKISAEDYAALKASYTPRALEELRARDAGRGDGTGDGAAADADPAEALVRAARSRATVGSSAVCSAHGVRPEADAVFCSDCGRYLGHSCLKCGARVVGDRSRYCTECGASLAA